MGCGVRSVGCGIDDVVPRGGLEGGLVLEGKVAALAGAKPRCHVGGFEAERAAPCHGVDKGDVRWCSVILSGVRSTKSKDLDGLENHAGGKRFLEGGVVHEPLVPALVQFFAREVEHYGAAIVDECDVEGLGMWSVGCGIIPLGGKGIKI